MEIMAEARQRVLLESLVPARATDSLQPMKTFGQAPMSETVSTYFLGAEKIAS